MRALDGALMMEAASTSETTQKTSIFLLAALRTWNLTKGKSCNMMLGRTKKNYKKLDWVLQYD